MDVIVVVGCVLAAALALVLASVLDVPALRLVAVGLLAAAVVARAIGAWGVRGLMMLAGVLLLAVAVGFAMARLGW
jgi:hypothetical protein